MSSIEGRVTVVTGVTSGFGRGVAKEFVRRGAKVVGTGRRVELGESLSEEIAAAGLSGDFLFVQGDVAKKADCDRMVQTAIDRHGRLDVLINNAGVVGTPAIVDTHLASEEWWTSTVAINLHGTFFCAQAALVAFLDQGDGGVILNIASINGDTNPMARMAAYNSSKAAVIQLTKTIASEYVQHGIRANSILLGGVEGDTGSAVQEDILKYLDAPGKPHTNPALLMPSDGVAGALAALASDDCRYVTGASIAIDNAFTAGVLNSTAIYLMATGFWPLPTA